MKMIEGIPADEFRLAERLAAQGLRIQRDNAKFHAATPAQKRVILAKDVLKWLNTNKLRAAGESGRGSSYLVIPEISSYEGVTKVNGYSCTACAIGGLFAVAAEHGSCSLTDGCGRFVALFGRDGTDVQGAIRDAMETAGLFSASQLALIEWAYELGAGIPTPPDSLVEPGTRARAYAFGYGYEQGAERMRAIMTNIIANKGEFIP
jgi:hypothetical protein